MIMIAALIVFLGVVLALMYADRRREAKEKHAH